MNLCTLASKRSNCMKRRVGAIIAADNRVVSTGYNGTPRGVKNCNEGGCPRCNSNAPGGEKLDLCLCLHAEVNAFLEAGSQRCRGATLYTTTFPCLQCTKKAVQVGIQRIVYEADYHDPKTALDLLGGAGVKIQKLPPISRWGPHHGDQSPHPFSVRTEENGRENSIH